MNYVDELCKIVDEYFTKVIMPYGQTNSEAIREASKFTPFKKKKYDEFIERFDKHRSDAMELSMSEAEFPEEDAKATALVDAFEQSKDTFTKLCRRNKEYYEFRNRKTRHEDVTVNELKETMARLRVITNSAMRDVDALEKAYKNLKGIEETDE